MTCCLHINEVSLNNSENLSTYEILEINAICCNVLMAHLHHWDTPVLEICGQNQKLSLTLSEGLMDLSMICEAMFYHMLYMLRKDTSKRIVRINGKKPRNQMGFLGIHPKALDRIRSEWVLPSLEYVQIINMVATMATSSVLFFKARNDSLEGSKIVKESDFKLKRVLKELSNDFNTCKSTQCEVEMLAEKLSTQCEVEMLKNKQSTQCEVELLENLLLHLTMKKGVIDIIDVTWK